VAGAPQEWTTERQPRTQPKRRKQPDRGVPADASQAACQCRHLEVNDLAAGAPLDILAPSTAPVERGPAILDPASCPIWAE
jgi:hypothetical protein